jgi:AraC-like DNA-binding protein
MAHAAKRKPAVGMTSIRLVWPFIELARKHGYAHTVERVHELFGLTQEELNDPDTRVPQQRVADLLSLAIERSGQRDIGLLAARYVDSTHVGIGEFLARSRPTLREAIESGVQYVALLGEGAQYHFEVQGKLAVSTIRFDPRLSIHEAAYEFVVALGILRARRMTGIETLAPIEVSFTHPRPADTRRHEKLLRCRVRFGMPVTQIVMSAESLEMRMASAEPALGQILERQAEAMLERLPRSDTLAARVRSVLRSERGLRSASAARTAQRLGLSVRSLSRRLDDEGTSYRALIDEARKLVALRELARDTCTIGELADQLGFASSPSFHRAFKRWTGMSAALFRREAQRKR